jgi:hypothetical protein
VADPLGASRGTTTATATTRLCVLLAACVGRRWRTSAWAQAVRSCLRVGRVARSLVYLLVVSALLRNGRWVGGCVGVRAAMQCVVFCCCLGGFVPPPAGLGT